MGELVKRHIGIDFRKEERDPKTMDCVRRAVSSDVINNGRTLRSIFENIAGIIRPSNGSSETLNPATPPIRDLEGRKNK